MIKDKGLLKRLYRALWSSIGGRPWTFILRDTWHRLEGIWILGLIAVGAICSHYFGLIGVLKGLAIFTIGYIAGHLFWGKRYIPNRGKTVKNNQGVK